MKKERTTNRMKKLEMIEMHTKNAEELRKEALLSLSEKLEQKRELKLKEQRLQEELKQERLKEKQRLHQEKENVIKKHWENQEIGAERSALKRIEQSKKEAPIRNTAKRIGLLKSSSMKDRDKTNPIAYTVGGDSEQDQQQTNASTPRDETSTTLQPSSESYVPQESSSSLPSNTTNNSTTIMDKEATAVLV
nr:unnamed protein product [Naegleria fowleri]